MAVLATLVTNIKTILPSRFLLKDESGDAKLSIYIQMVISEINTLGGPLTNYDVTSMPSTWNDIVVFGANAYATLFVLGGYSLKDFNFSDGGLSLNPERTAKLTAYYELLYRSYLKMVYGLKRAEILKIRPQGVGSISYMMAAASPSNTLNGAIRSLYGVNIYSSGTASSSF